MIIEENLFEINLFFKKINNNINNEEVQSINKKLEKGKNHQETGNRETVETANQLQLYVDDLLETLFGE